MFPSAFAVVRGSTYSVRSCGPFSLTASKFKHTTSTLHALLWIFLKRIRLGCGSYGPQYIYIYIYICKFTKETRARYSTVLHRELNLRIVSSGNVELMNLPYMLSLQMEWCMVLLCFFLFLRMFMIVF